MASLGYLHEAVLHGLVHRSSPSMVPMKAMTAKMATKVVHWQHLLDRPSKAGSCPCSDCQEATRDFLLEQSRLQLRLLSLCLGEDKNRVLSCTGIAWELLSTDPLFECALHVEHTIQVIVQ